ncbi:MAG: hypothetical protein C0434_11610 [Xanthomonadaceae bacterium]|nr:hypothetical protein [Xanthomonadaceae bacterium]
MSNTLRIAALIAATTLSMGANADNAAWLKAKNPALNRSAAQEAPARADQPAAGSIEAWKQAKFPALSLTDAKAVDLAPSAVEPKAGSIEAWKRAKFPHLQKTSSRR